MFPIFSTNNNNNNSLTWWLGSASDVIGKKRVILANFIGLFVSLVGSGVLVFTEQHPVFLICTGVFYDLTGGFGILLTVLLASVTSSYGFKFYVFLSGLVIFLYGVRKPTSSSTDGTRLYRIIIIDLALLLPSLVMAPVGIWVKKYGLDYIYYITFSSSILILIATVLAAVFYKDPTVYHPDTLG